jgi:LmbE family N-acetylglucosaminyl deacetylase
MFGKRVLLLIPHPDDELVGAAIAIERLRRDGGEAHALYLTSGVPANSGAWFGGRARYAGSVERRRAEAERVARSLGLSIAGSQDVASRELKANLATSLEWVRRHTAEIEPDRIWVPAYEGGHQDHDVTHFIGSMMGDACAVWEFSEYNYVGGRVRSQEFIRPNGTEIVLDLDSEERSRKREWLSLYASEQRNLGYVGLDREVFRPIARYDYGRPPHPGPCFYERFHWVPIHPRIDYCRPDQVCDAFKQLA